MAMDCDRREFLRDLSAGTAGLVFGGFVPGAPRAWARVRNAPPAAAFTVPTGPSGGPVFPFFADAARYDFGEYVPKDQGGKFIQAALVGSESDAAVAEAIRGGLIERTYGEPIGWSRFEKTEIEKSVWLNRFYYLPPFARLYFRTKARRYLDDMMRVLGRWMADNPRFSTTSTAVHVWRDMQVAWRAIHLSWCWYLAGDGLRENERAAILRLQQDHADVLLSGFGRAPLNEFNHQSHGGLAMLYLGVLFPDLAGADSLRQTGIRILNHHLARAFHADGGNVEQMFGYYPFQAHIFRDAYLLCAANGLEPPAGSLPGLEKMAAYLHAVAQPDGTMPPVNDSYEMPVQPTLGTIDAILKRERPRPEAASTFFPDTQIAVLRSGRPKPWYVLANPARTIGAHAHAGRLAVNVWFAGKPVLVDSGCCNYDDPALVTWFRTTRAHNTVSIDGRSDTATSSSALWAPKRETANRITDWQTTAGITCCRMHSPASEAVNAGVAWTRAVALVRGDFVVIHDAFDASGEHDYQVLLHFPPRDVAIDGDRHSLVVRGEDGVRIVPAAPELPDGITLVPEPISIKGVSTPAPMASCSFKRSGPVRIFFVIVPCTDAEPGPVVTQTAGSEGLLLSVTGGRIGTTTVLFSSGGARIIARQGR